MATTFSLFYLGVAPFFDTVEGNNTSENHGALQTLTFGSAGDPLYDNVRTLSPGNYAGGDATAYDANNSLSNDTFRIDGGALQTFDAAMMYTNTLITYTDGTSAYVSALVMQDTAGNLYLLPPTTGPSAYSDALEAKPIQSVTLGTANPASGTNVYGMAADRFALTLKDGEVEGTGGNDVIDASYTGDPEGDRVDSNDGLDGSNGDLIRAYGGDDSVVAGLGNDTVVGGSGNDTVFGGDGADLIHGDTEAVLVSFEDFEGGASGWTNSPTGTGGQFGTFLGPFDGTAGDSSGGPLTEKTFDLADGFESVVVEFDLYIIDSWDANDPTYSAGPAGDAFQLYVNGNQVTSELFSHWDSNFHGDRIGSVTIDGVDYTFRFVLQSQGTDLGYSTFGDQIWRVRLEAENYNADQISIGFGSTTDEGAANESFGIDNLWVASTNDTQVQFDDIPGNDVLHGGQGNDTVYGGGGDDLIYGDGGDDRLYGGAGADTLEGGDGNDLVFGGDGNDSLDGNNGDDTLDGGAGNDTIEAGAGNDLVYGGAGDDSLFGGAGDDSLFGGAGADRITFDSGDTVYGGAGDDTFVLEDLGETGDIYVYGGDDDETEGGGDTLDLGFLSDRKTLNITSTTTNASGNTSYSGSVQMDNGSMLFFEGIENIICFTPGTRIATARGEVPVEGLQRGDLVVTRDNGLQPIRWIETRSVPGHGRFAPVRIRRSVLAGLTRDLILSPQHRVLFEGYRAELLFGEREVLACAAHLVDGHAVRRERVAEVTYVHFLLDRHEIVYAEGAATESFHPGGIGLDAVGHAAREELFAIFPELRADLSVYGRSARRCLRRFETALILT